MEALPKHEEFVPQLNSKFNVQVDEANAVELVLSEVGELKTTDRQELFSIVFRGPLEVFLGQGIRQLQHEALGELGLFLVPIKQDESGFYYESVFNRLKK